MTSSKQDFYYLGICPFLSSENVMARLNLGISELELNCAQIMSVVQAQGYVVIPSHFWWRKDNEELLNALQSLAPKISIQCGPGFELNEKHYLVLRALTLGFHIQIICQKRLAYSQEHRLKDFLQFGEQLEISFFVEETGDPLGDIRFFCDHYLQFLSISLTQFSFGLLSELALTQAEFKTLKFLDYSKKQRLSFDEAVERTPYAFATTSFRVKSIRFPTRLALKFLSFVISFVFMPKIENLNFFHSAFHFVKSCYTRFFWSTRSLIITSSSKTYWLVRSLLSHTYFLILSYPLWPLRKTYWFLKFQYEKRVLRQHEN